MPQDYEVKGILSLYNDILSLFPGEPQFFEWIKDNNIPGLQSGQICSTIPYYAKRKRFSLASVKYDELDEERSTWQAKRLTNRLPFPSGDGHVMKYFELESEESLITLHCKIRPAILLHYNSNNWWNQADVRFHIETWTCLPIFSYKGRHTQGFVLKDQSMETDRFYMPPFYSTNAGLPKESAAIYSYIQTIPIENILPLRIPCIEDSINHSIKLSKDALKLVLYHYYKMNHLFNEIESIDTYYDVFKDMVTDIINDTISNKNIPIP
jgi:hypothetical protein